ncbi:MAG: hypothetical protein MR006_03430 [Arcanobacterium sp.]|nr:hypothetical protein [Arcanobacterium sp.]
MELSYYRKALWHLRHGGVAQMQNFRLRAPTSRHIWHYPFPVPHGKKSLDEQHALYRMLQELTLREGAQDTRENPPHQETSPNGTQAGLPSHHRPLEGAPFCPHGTPHDSQGAPHDSQGVPHHSRGAPFRFSTLISTIRPQLLEHVFQFLAAQQGVELQPIIATHGFAASCDTQAQALDYGLSVQWLECDARLTLGEVYNEVLQHADQPLIAKFDDDDLYGSAYLATAAAMLRAANADIVGKFSHFVYLESADAVYLRCPHYDHRYSNFVPGATIVADTAAVQQLGFAATTLGEDNSLMERAVCAGLRIYSGSPFGYCTVRGKQEKNHTWAVADDKIMAEATFVHRGQPGDFECVN